MATTTSALQERVHTAVPLVALVALALSWGRDLPTWLLSLVALVMAAAVLSAVHHAEIVALRVGEPFGSLVLAVAVTVIEVALIVTLMTTSDKPSQTLARDTVFAALMITVNGMVGAALLVATLRGGTARFNAAGAGSGLAAIGVLATFSLVLPSFTRSSPGPTFTDSQLAFAAVAALTVYLLFVFVQTVRHRDYFLAAAGDSEAESEEYEPPTNAQTMVSLVFLLISLFGVVLVAKMLAPALDDLIDAAGLPHEFTGVVIAALVLAPESIAAVRASLANRPQTSINLALGSALASIALTIPAITLIAAFTDVQLALGVPPAKVALLVLAMFVSVITLLPGRTTVLHGVVHLALFVMFIVVAAVP